MANELIDRHCFYTRVAITTLQESYETKHARHERKRLMNIANHMMYDVFHFTCPLVSAREREFSPQYVELYERYMEVLKANGIDPTDGDFNLVAPTVKVSAAACPRCGGWTSFGGMSPDPER